MLKDGGFQVPLVERLKIASKTLANVSWNLQQKGTSNGMATIDVLLLAICEGLFRAAREQKQSGFDDSSKALTHKAMMFLTEARALEEILGQAEQEPQIILTDAAPSLQ
jgi:hypothetical protein